MKLDSGYVKFYGTAQILEPNKDDFYGDQEELEVTYIKFDDGYVILKENPNDGYRSSGEIEFSKECPKKLTFNLEHKPKIIYRDFDTDFLGKENQRWGQIWNGLLLRYNKEGDIFGHFGTDASDDYYPCYHCNLDIKKMNKLFYQGTELYKTLNKE